MCTIPYQIYGLFFPGKMQSYKANNLVITDLQEDGKHEQCLDILLDVQTQISAFSSTYPKQHFC